MPRRSTPVRILISAEHASRRVPARWSHCFPDRGILETHRAWDPGTGQLARELASGLNTDPMLGGATRLLIDLNRPAQHPHCYSEFTRPLGGDERTELLEFIHRPYWQRYRERVSEPGRCLHLACHSFTAVFEGQRRSTDIALLFDPNRFFEARWCQQILAALRRDFPRLRVHANQPYRGTSSGLGQYHRAFFPLDKLLTAELEISQALIARPSWPETRARLIDCLLDSLD